MLSVCLDPQRLGITQAFFKLDQFSISLSVQVNEILLYNYLYPFNLFFHKKHISIIYTNAFTVLEGRPKECEPIDDSQECGPVVENSQCSINSDCENNFVCCPDRCGKGTCVPAGLLINNPL